MTTTACEVTNARKPNRVPKIALCVRHSERRAAKKAVKDGKSKLYRDGAISIVTLVRHLLLITSTATPAARTTTKTRQRVQ